ncbi:hypothetical protein niasHT_026899 [Heterodera trifolii]|uniref:G-protein coupled receptors family 3 profile domain-containing protein n=1 Tax=Heterodera trifolii TaxID=157864 RepID=A0ABD2JY75_9BILA
MEAGSGGWPGGQACLPAIQMAFEDVNMEPDLLPNYALRLHQFNSKCQPGLAAWQLFELLYKPPTKLILLSGCSPVTTLVSEAAPVWNLLVLSYGASSPALSNRARFSTLFRTHPSANMQNPTRVHLFEKFKWKRITILQSVEEVFDSTAKDLEEQCSEKGIRVERHSFYGDPTDALKAIRRQDARIIVGLFYVTEARRVLCQAYLHGLYGRRYVWFMIGWYSDAWFIPPEEEALNCSRAQMERAAQFHFTTESVMLSRDLQPAISGMTGEQFQTRLRRRISTDPHETGGWPEAPLAYDAVWALALTLNCTMGSLPFGVNSLEQFTYNSTGIARKMFKCMKNTRFRGVSGQVMFSDLGDRIARTQIEQMQDGKYVILGYYDSNSQSLEWFRREKFVGSRGPPPDSTRVKQWPITVDFRLFCATMVFTCVGIALTIALWLFCRRHANRRAFIQSQPHCNRLLLVGSFLCLLSLVFLGFPTDVSFRGRPLLRFSSNLGFFSAFCHFRVFLLMIGFTFAYGALFAKIWVAHKLNSAEKRRQMATTFPNNEEESTSLGQANSVSTAVVGAGGGQTITASGSPWGDSVRTLFTAVVGRQPMISAALRKISQHSSYGNLSEGGSSTNRRNANINLLVLPIHPSKFYIVIGSMAFVDLVVTVFWVGLDPMKRLKIHFPLQDPPVGMRLEDVMLMPILELCQSNRHEMWTVIVLGHKGLLLLLGLFLAYETRQLKPRYLSDLRSTILSVCNVGVLCLLTGPIIAFFLRNQPNPFFGFVSVTVLTCLFVSLGLVFVPKLLFIYHWPELTKEEQQQSTQRQLLEGSAPNRSEQLRYQQLLKENAEIKRQIELRNLRIQECRRILEGHITLTNPLNKAKNSTVRRRQKQQQNNNNNNANLDNNKNDNNNNDNYKNGSERCKRSDKNTLLRPCSSAIGLACLVDFEPTTTSVGMDPTTTITLLEPTTTASGGEEFDEAAPNYTTEESEGGGIAEENVVELASPPGIGKGNAGGEERAIARHADRPPVEAEEERERGGRAAARGGEDTGVCSDYEEDEDEADGEGSVEKVELMSTESDDANWPNGDEEEILL